MASPWGRLASQALRLAVREGPRIAREIQRRRSASPGSPNRTTRARTIPGATVPRPPSDRSTTRSTPPSGRHLDYAPALDGRADPGEIVWTWVAFEEDASQGKDRPALVVGRQGDTLLGLMLSSQDYHRGDPAWLSLGAGPWDREGRPSWLRLDRVLEIPEAGIRREGAVLDRERFDRVASALRNDFGWS